MVELKEEEKGEVQIVKEQLDKRTANYWRRYAC